MTRLWRQLPAALLAWALIVAIGHAQTDSNSEERGPLAILILNPDPDDGAPPYALADQFGRVQRLVEESTRIDLDRYIGQRVRIRHDTGRTLLASQLELPGESEPSSLRQVSPAQFVPPRRAKRIDQAVRAVQATDDTLDGFLDDSAESIAAPPGDLPLPGPASGAPDTTPIDLDSLPTPSGARDEPLEPTPAVSEDYEVLPEVIEPIRSRHEPRRALETASPACDCPRCRAKKRSHSSQGKTLGRSPGWCGPTCNPASRRGAYGRVDYLLWSFPGMDIPPLAVTNDAGAMPIIGQADTRAVFGGNDDLLDNPRNGLRLTVGAWLDEQRDLAFEADWMLFDTESLTFAFNDQPGALILGRPFFNVGVVDEEAVRLISFPGLVGGALQIYSRSEFESAGLRLRTGICCREVGGSCDSPGCDQCRRGKPGRPRAISRIDFTGGYRYARLDELIRFADNSTPLTPPGDRVDVGEGFRVDNDFHGVDLGFVYDWQAKRWGLELSSRIAIGGTRQRVTISGANTVTPLAGAGPMTSPGGLLAQITNSGSFARERFSVLPELSARLSYRVTPQLNLSAGYTLLYWANVVRPGDQIDLLVDERLLDGALPNPSPNTPPNFDFAETSLWAHGFNLGLDYQY